MSDTELILERVWNKDTAFRDFLDIFNHRLISKSATVTINLPDESQRYLNGIVARFIQAGSDARLTTYYAELRPWFWQLTLTVDIPFRPPRTTSKPVIACSQTAIVVGKSGEEIWTDKYGRIKVQFH